MRRDSDEDRSDDERGKREESESEDSDQELKRSIQSQEGFMETQET